MVLPLSGQKLEELKRDYRSVALLEDFDQVMSKLKLDNLILIDPDSDFGDFDEAPIDLIKAKIPPYIRHAYYQFYEKKLCIISLFWEPKLFSYLELYKKMKIKYGAPLEYLSNQAKWENEKTIIILDNLPSIKYIDKESFGKIEKMKKNQLEKDKVKDSILEGL
jgi:hypothetical protein